MDPDLLLADATVEAAVGALAARNTHHLEDMTEEERADAALHWRELVIDVLSAARATVGDDDAPAAEEAGEGPGRAVVVFEDAGGEDVAVHASFHPELSPISEQEVAGTPAQVMALSMLDQLAEDTDEEED